MQLREMGNQRRCDYLLAMPSIDFPLEQCRKYKPELNKQADFDSFWDTTLRESSQQPMNAEFVPYPVSFKGVKAYRVFFDGFKGGRIAGHYVRPDVRTKVPGLCIYHGYSGRAPRPLEMLPYAYAGIAVLSMDCRGQLGDSTDGAMYEGHSTGWMTQGIRNPSNYYYRYVYSDAVRALELLASREDVDASRLTVTGVSQGGGISLAVSALSSKVTFCWSDVPFLCDFRRAVAITATLPYLEITNFLKQYSHLEEQAFKTLSYIDCVNLAPRIKAKTVITIGVQDDICPPSGNFAAYNHIPHSNKDVVVCPFHKHEMLYDQIELRYRAIVDAMDV